MSIEPSACKDNSNENGTIDVIRGNDVKITFTMPKRLESRQILFFTKERNVKLGMCLQNRKCYHLDGDYERNKFRTDGNGSF